MHRIGFIAYPDFQVLSLCTVSAFECANILSAKPLYELHMLSETGGPSGSREPQSAPVQSRIPRRDRFVAGQRYALKWRDLCWKTAVTRLT